MDRLHTPSLSARHALLTGTGEKRGSGRLRKLRHGPFTRDIHDSFLVSPRRSGADRLAFTLSHLSRRRPHMNIREEFSIGFFALEMLRPSRMRRQISLLPLSRLHSHSVHLLLFRAILRIHSLRFRLLGAPILPHFFRLLLGLHPNPPFTSIQPLP